MKARPKGFVKALLLSLLALFLGTGSAIAQTTAPLFVRQYLVQPCIRCERDLLPSGAHSVGENAESARKNFEVNDREFHERKPSNNE